MDFTNATDLIFAKLYEWLGVAVSMVPNLILAIAISISTLFLSRFVIRSTQGLASAVIQNKSVARTLSVGAGVLVTAIGFFIVLAVLNLDQIVSSLLLGTGILILALSFAFQDIASNFISGLLLQLGPPFQPGDIIETGTIVGTASQLTLRATEVKTFDGTTILIPNNQIYQQPLINYTGIGKRRVVLRGSLANANDLTKGQQVAINAIAGLSVRDTARDVEFFYRSFHGDGVVFEISFWIDFRRYMDLQQSRSQAIVALQEAFQKEELTLAPFTATF